VPEDLNRDDRLTAADENTTDEDGTGCADDVLERGWAIGSNDRDDVHGHCTPVAVVDWFSGPAVIRGG
jgi:hypothetical protein